MSAPLLKILYCDDQLVAVHKPSGMLVHRTYLERRETYFALQLLRNQLGERVYPLHRLDRPTSGVLLFARSGDVARRMGSAFQNGEVRKRYLALVRGWSDPEGNIDYPLADLDASRNGVTAPKEAVTRYRQQRRYELPYAVGRYPTSRYTLLELYPHHGRRHQLRRHMKHIFHPIIGDVNYGDGRHNRFFRERFGCNRMMLAATELSFRHPESGGRVSIETLPEENFEAVMSKLSPYAVARSR